MSTTVTPATSPSTSTTTIATLAAPAAPAKPAKASKEKGIRSLAAGAIAGGIEATITYPFESAKTILQLPGSPYKGPVDCIVQTVRTRGVLGLYDGLSALVIGTAAKAAVRFATYDSIKNMLADPETGKLTKTRSMLAGLGAGMTEAVLVVTPTETIKTKIIHDAARSKAERRFKGLGHAVTTIVREEGPRGVYRGLGPVMARQGANSAIRFTAYGAAKDALMAYKYPEYSGQSDGAATAGPPPQLPTYMLFASGVVAGIITVYTTMPLDVVKTHRQSLEGHKYRNAFHCFTTILKVEGPLALWKGAVPRLGRLSMSGGIVFTAYEQCLRLFKYFD
ncbi:mitochondrial tricarboxylate transporter [Ramicandelaber brevisporus]|nr:mitochondrial tricarboxylate transporter [Ramicandelaber brevisporus]